MANKSVGIKKQINELVTKISSDKTLRRATTRQSHFWFFHVFFGHYIGYPAALFHREMFRLTESKHKLIVVMAFRGSGKSTIMNLSYAIWSILGKPKKKCVLIVCQTQQQARTHLLNIRGELERNNLLATDLGPFKVEGESWGANSLILPKYNARIVALSREQNMRGMRHGERRPDLIICDDIEDAVSSENKEDRDRTYRWLLEEVIPSGDQNTQVVVLGNLLHSDSLLMRLRDGIKNRRLAGVFRAYPIVDDYGRPLWPRKFSSNENLERFKRNVADKKVWQNEYLLEVGGEDENGQLHWVSSRKELEEFEKAERKKRGVRRLGYFRISAPKISKTIISWII